jgi:hypothetical protein
MALRRTRRRAPEPLAPIIYRWDLDKTYLKSEFDSLRGLIRVPFEKPQDKVAVPGVAPLIRSLREVAVDAQRPVRIYFMSASPPQIAKAIKQKLAMDGIEYDGIVFKNQLQHLMRGKFRNLREHVGFKLTELLKSRQHMPAESREVLFGDDWESDPIIYSLYADVLAGGIATDNLDGILGPIGVDRRLVALAKELAAAVVPADVVQRIFINIERRTPPKDFRAFGPRLVPSFNYFQTAACLFEEGHLTLPAVAAVAESLIGGSGYSPARLANSLADVVRRGHLRPASAMTLRGYLQTRKLLPEHAPDGVRPSLWERLKRRLQPQVSTAPASPEAINYETLIAHWRAAR